MLDWSALEIFIAAARLENFSAAAQELHLSQPAITQRIRNLERYLDVTLFEREGRRVYLSEAGAYLLPLAEDLLRRSKRVEEMMHSLSGQVVGHLVIGCSTTSGKYILPRLLARFRQQHPGVRATIQVGSRARVLDLLLSRGVHLAFSSARIEHRDISYEQFFDDDVVLIAPAGHRSCRWAAIEPADLLHESLILREQGSGTYHAVVEALAPFDISPAELNTVMTLGNSEAIVMAVEEGIGVGFVPLSSARRHLHAGKICIVPIAGVQIRHTVWMAENRLQPATPAQIHFQELLRAARADELRPADTQTPGRVDAPPLHPAEVEPSVFGDGLQALAIQN